ncbi:MAG: hypothetical protein GXO86_03785, partial [Chlorobi bacterium]|nr:hypothetical protein [Chlorobiota bacterium]
SKLEKLLRRIGEAETAFLVKYYNVTADTDQFCEDLQKLLETARDGFQGIKGEKIPGTLMGSSYKVTASPVYSIDGKVEDWYFPQAIYTYYRGTDQAAAEKYFKDLDKVVNNCQLGFNRTEVLEPSSESSNKDKMYKYIEKEEGKSGRAVIINLHQSYSGYEVQLVVNNYELKK